MMMNPFASSSGSDEALRALLQTHFKAGSGASGSSSSRVVYRGFVQEGRAGRIVSSHLAWTRKYLCLDDTKLYYLRLSRHGSSGCLESEVLCDTMFSSIKVARDVSPNAFTICSSGSGSGGLFTTTIKCGSSAELAEWVSAIGRAIELRLAGPKSSHEGGSASAAARRRRGGVRAEMAIAIETITAINNECADCGAVKPDWVLLSFGALVCIHCSGAHRSIGTTVRSLALDDLQPLEYQLLLQIGNDAHNAIWEAEAPASGARPAHGQGGVGRLEFVRAKYTDKAFLRTGIGAQHCCSSDDHSTFNEMLLDACRNNDVHTAALALANGADANYKPGSGEASCLDRAMEHDHRSVAVLLLLNGYEWADCGAAAALAVALATNRRGELAEYVAAKYGGDGGMRDKNRAKS